MTTLSRREIAQVFAGESVEPIEAVDEIEEPTDETIVSAIFIYAALLKLRALWTPSLPGSGRKRAIANYLAFLVDELAMLPFYTVQLAANMWLHGAEANSQAARLLKFRQVADRDALRAIWGAAWDVHLLSLQRMLDEMFRDERALDMVIVTADKALVELRQFAPSVGIGVFVKGGDDEVRTGLVSLNFPDDVMGEVQPILDRLQTVRIARAKRGKHYSHRLADVLALVERLEADLLGRSAAIHLIN